MFGWPHFFCLLIGDDAAVIYAFCRLVDDAADEAPSVEMADQPLNKLMLNSME